MPALVMTGMDQLPAFIAQSGGGSSPMLVGIGSGLVLLLLILLALAIGYSFNKHWIRAGTPKPNAAANQAGIGVCGRCGYPARGITTFECPECGADLREAGIVRPGQGQHKALGCAPMIIFTIAVVVLGTLFAQPFTALFPGKTIYTYEHKIVGTSGQFNTLMLKVEGYEKQNPSSGGSWGQSSSGLFSFGQPQKQIDFSNFTPGTRLQQITIELLPMQAPAASSKMIIDPGKPSFQSLVPSAPQTSKPGHPATQDILDFFKASGVKTTDPVVQQEADELFLIIDGLSQGQAMFSLNAIGVLEGDESTQWIGTNDLSQGLYTVGWFVLWLLGMIYLVRKGRGSKGQ